MALLLIPGPAVMYIVTRSAAQGRTAGLVSVAGIHVGTVVHVVAAMLGLSAVLAPSATALTVVKLAGAGYLIWLGLRSLRAYRTGRAPDAVPRAAPVRCAGCSSTASSSTSSTRRRPSSSCRSCRSSSTPTPRTRCSTSPRWAVFIVLGLLSDSAALALRGWVGTRLRGSRTAARTDLFASGTYLVLGTVTAFSGHRRT
ncbi:MAG: LysE family translocator [Acidimicrobiales bacterium]